MLILSAIIRVQAQEPNEVLPDTGCVQKDLKDLVRESLHRSQKKQKKGDGSILLVPIIGSNPATGFMVGVGGQAAFKMPGSDTYSSFSGSAQFTTKSQMIFMLKNNMYTKGNRFYLEGDWRYLVFSQSTYGLGTNAPEGGLLEYQYHLFGMETTEDSLAQPMKFNFARIHQLVSFRLYKGLMAGIGYEFDLYSNIRDKKLSIGPVDTLLTSHYVYNVLTGFDTKRYNSSLVSFNLTYDTRDNIMNAYRGYFATVGYKFGPEFLGNPKTSSSFDFEWRSFHGLSKRNPRHLIAFWAMGNITREGDLPYMILPATAYDQRNRNSRGYTQGRFRGPKFLYGEVEYRFPISRCTGILGGVIFLNATTTDNPVLDVDLFESVRPAYGAGLRVMIDKASRMNLAVDLAWGHHSFGFYLNVTESF
jgi:outer membrane protein assembly factor BamA